MFIGVPITNITVNITHYALHSTFLTFCFHAICFISVMSPRWSDVTGGNLRPLRVSTWQISLCMKLLKIQQRPKVR